MLTASLARVIARDLRALRREVEAYADERDLWRVVPGITNPGGALALYLAGNLQHFVGAVVGGTGYVRDRAAEFHRRDVPRSQLLRQVDETLVAVERTLAALGEDALARPFPQPHGGAPVTTGAFLLHLATHLTYHLGQIDYHRRMLTGQAGQIRAVAVDELDRSPPVP